MKSPYRSRTLILILLLVNFTNECISQNFRLVKDINSATDANPANYNDRLFNNNSKRNVFAVLNGIGYFGADDGVHGLGLWRSDGTSAGTYQVKEGVNPTNITAVNGKLYFAGTGNLGLWMSDGTEAGTVPVLNQLPSGLSSFNPAGLTDFNGTLVFLISGNNSNTQLWKTDGTVPGTVRIKDFYNADPARSFADLRNLIVIKNKIFFSAATFSPSYSMVLGVSDGSASGTYIISKDVVEPAEMIEGSANDSLVYFSASVTSNGPRTLYVTNGDSGNVAKASGFNGFIHNNFYGTDITSIESVIYFTGHPDAFTKPLSLYKFDIKAATGIQPVKVVSGTNANGAVSTVTGLTNVDGTLYFNVYDATNNKNQVWRSNGNSEGNVLLKDSLSGGNFIKVNGVIYFHGFDHQGGEIWKTDGTVNGTSIVRDINEGFKSSNPQYLTAVNGKAVFSANDGVHGYELWTLDGSAAGTTLVKDINQATTPGSHPNGLTPFNDTLIFSAITSGNLLLWKSDGTSKGTTIINDTVNTSFVQYPKTHIIRNNQMYFFGTSLSARQGIYKINVTSGEATLIKDFTGVSINSYPPIATDSLVYFPLQNPSTGKNELWRTDGIATNTFIVKDDFPYFNSSLFVPAATTLFFVIENSNSIWKTDGTIAGTVMVKSFDYVPYRLAAFNGMLFFGVYDFVGSNVWRSDGTAAGTIKLTTDANNPESFTTANGKLFFIGSSNSGTYGNIGNELFKTDGTISGTVLVKDIHAGSAGTTIYKSISLNGILYFFTNPTSTSYIELWKSDGTSAGTQLISAIANDGSSTAPNALVTCNGKLFFMVGNILWESNGVANGTHPVQDNIFSSVTIQSFDNSLTATKNKLFFTASNYTYGQELYVGNVSAEGIINYLTISDGNWNNPAIWADNVVPPEGASVIIKNAVTVNVNVTCNGLLVAPAGNLIVNPGIILTVLH